MLSKCLIKVKQMVYCIFAEVAEVVMIGDQASTCFCATESCLHCIG